jgi:hemerythrin-like metal-binding protein
MLGHPVIDEDHQLLVASVNQLHAAMRAGKSASVLTSIFDGLDRYTHEHFSREELIWSKGNPAALTKQHADHQVFIDFLKKSRVSFEEGGLMLGNEVLSYLRDWLSNHILVSDRGAVKGLRAGGEVIGVRAAGPAR